jgi:hypothetical protein
MFKQNNIDLVIFVKGLMLAEKVTLLTTTAKGFLRSL